MANDRADLIRVTSKLADLSVVAAVGRGGKDSLRNAIELGLVNLGALDEEDVEPFVLVLGQQQCARRSKPSIRIFIRELHKY